MTTVPLEGSVIDRLRQRYPAYHETAYLFILSGLQHTLEGIGKPRHVTGKELAEGCRELALDRFGPLARSVLGFWGVESTRDLGEVVFALVECGVLVAQEGDTISDFEALYDFETAFEADYPWIAPASVSGP